QVVLWNLTACGHSRFRGGNGRSAFILVSLAGRAKQRAETVEALASVDLSAIASHLEWFSGGIEEVHRAAHLRLGGCGRVRWWCDGSFGRRGGRKLRGWYCLLGLINLCVAVEQLVVTQLLWVLQVWCEFSFDERPREFHIQPWLRDDFPLRRYWF